MPATTLCLALPHPYDGYSTHFLKTVPLFKGLENETLECFIQSAQVSSYKKGKVIYLEEESARFFYVIQEGWVKLFHETLDGEEAIINILTKGQIFAEEVIFHNDIHTSSAQIVDDAKIFTLPISLLKEHVHSNNKLALNMLHSMSKLRRWHELELEHFAIQNAPQRISCFLLRMCPHNQHKQVTLHLPYDKTLLASKLGMKPETFSRALNTLREKTNIRVCGARIDIDTTDQLSEFSCNSCSFSYPCHHTV